MSKQNEHISEVEIQGYLNGEMDAAEQHAFEAKLENDPFAYAAVEGLEDLSQAQVARALQKLQMEATEAEQRFSWMKIAAVVTIALISGLALWYYTQPQQPSQIAYEETSAPQAEQEIEAVPAEPSQTPPLQESTSETVPDAVTNEEEQPEPNAPVAIVEVPALADAQSINPPAQKPAEELTTLRNEVAVTLEENQATQDEIQVAEEVLEETVVEDMVFEEQVAQDFELTQGATADQQLSRAAPAAKSMSRQSFSTNTPQPIGGLKAYQDYLTDSLRYTPEMGAGVVTLRFTIGQSGTPVDIQIIKGLNQQADMEATRLVAEGPKWSGSGGVPTTLSVRIKPE